PSNAEPSVTYPIAPFLPRGTRARRRSLLPAAAVPVFRRSWPPEPVPDRRDSRQRPRPEAATRAAPPCERCLGCLQPAAKAEPMAGGGEKMEAPRFLSEIFPQDHVDLSWVPDGMDASSAFRLAMRAVRHVKEGARIWITKLE
ncbi:unnamed protein product, partial [Urochloa humidicola]